MGLIGKKKVNKKTRMKLFYVLRKKMVFFEGVIIILTVEFGLAGVLISAIATANKMSI